MRMLVLACLIIGCSKEAVDEDPGWVGESATEEVAAMKQAIAANTPSKGLGKCGHMANLAKLRASSKHKALAAELERYCTKDLHLAIMKFEVERAEAAHAAKPDAEMLDECYTGDFSYAHKELIQAKKVDAAKDLVARF
jgi:hypothetical protein